MTTESEPSRQFAPLLRRAVITTLKAAAGPIPCHLVGGVLRDFLLGVPSRDLDVIVERDGQEVGERIVTELGARLVVLGGDRFAAFRIVATDLIIDLWDREQQSLTSDLARRDFTVNSFALDLWHGEVLDPHSGLDDLATRRLRATTEISFAGDPLRVLRLARFAGQLDGFTVVRQTLELAQRAVPQLESVAPERIREELRLVFSHPQSNKSFGLLEQLGVFPLLWIGRLPAGGGSSARQALDRFDRACRWLDQIAPDSALRPDPFAGRMAVLFDSLSRSGQSGALDLLQTFHSAGYLSKGDVQRISPLLRWQGLPREEGPQRWLLHEMGELWLTLACYLRTRGKERIDEGEWRQVVADLTRLAAEHGKEIFSPAPLLTGHEIQELLDMPPGPRVGRIAQQLRRLQVEGAISTRAAAEETVLELGSAPVGPAAED